MTTKEFQERSDLRIFLSYFKPHKKLFVLDMVYILPKSSDLRLSMAEKERNRLC